MVVAIVSHSGNCVAVIHADAFKCRDSTMALCGSFLL